MICPRLMFLSVYIQQLLTLWYIAVPMQLYAYSVYEYVLVLVYEFKIYCFITLISMRNLQQLYIELVNDSSFSEVCIQKIYFDCTVLWVTIRLTLIRPCCHNLTTGNSTYVCNYVVLTHYVKLCMYTHRNVYAPVCAIMYMSILYVSKG